LKIAHSKIDSGEILGGVIDIPDRIVQKLSLVIEMAIHAVHDRTFKRSLSKNQENENLSFSHPIALLFEPNGILTSAHPDMKIGHK
jgi:hypothetical protein